jgi:lysozyme
MTMAQSSFSSPSIQGIDVSHFQNTVDWHQVAQAGKQFAFIKATQGLTYVDPQLQTNWPGMKAAGLVRGAYHFYEPGDDPRQQAEFFLETVKLGPGDLPPALDVETANGQSASDIVKGLQVWLSTIQQELGVTPLLYTGRTFWNSLGTEAFSGYPLWIAEYGVTIPVLPSGWTTWSFWQFSETGTVSGIQGSVDLDVFQGSLEDLRRLAIPEGIG